MECQVDRDLTFQLEDLHFCGSQDMKCNVPNQAVVFIACVLAPRVETASVLLL